MRSIAFQKWEATGNDFLFIDSAGQGVTAQDLEVGQIRAVCDRRDGRGADGVVFYHLSHGSAHMSIINSDGSSGDMCGNALRCLAQILYRTSQQNRHEVRLAQRQVTVIVEHEGEGAVILGRPAPQGRHDLYQAIPRLDDEMGGTGYLLSFGNPHYVVPFSGLPDDWQVRGRNCQTVAHELLGTGGINCGFLSTEPGEGVYSLRVYERGAGPTLSCGSGACAASAVLEKIVGVEPPHRLSLPGGTLVISREGLDFVLSGPVRKEYEGVWEV